MPHVTLHSSQSVCLKLHNIVYPEINTEVIKRIYATDLILFF